MVGDQRLKDPATGMGRLLRVGLPGRDWDALGELVQALLGPRRVP